MTTIQSMFSKGYVGMDLWRYIVHNDQCQHCIYHGIKIPLLDSKINQFFYNVLPNLSFYLHVAFDWCKASLFIFDNRDFISICLFFFICVKIQMDATHGHCRITWHRHNSLSNASTWNISHSLSLSLQISPQMGLIVLDKEGRGREMKNSKPLFFIDNSSSQTSIQFSCAWVLQRWDVVLPRR